MDTQARTTSLQAGQAWDPRRGGGLAVLTRGEVLVQAPARWIGGRVVLEAPRRLVAPAVLPRDAGAVVALGVACVSMQPAGSALAERLATVAARLRAWSARRTAASASAPSHAG